MPMLETLLALAILTGDSPVDAVTIHVLRPQILALGLDAEIVDPREKGFLLGMDPVGDLETIRGRYVQFATAPLLHEARRFPDRTFVCEALALNRAYRLRLTERLGVDLIHADQIHATIQETDRRYEVWDAVRDARCDYYYVTIRRQSLSLLRDLIGDESFYLGRLPSVVP
jgi:hypothetical protein